MQRITQNIVLFLVVGLFLTACKVEDELKALAEFRDSEKIWIFSQFNVEQDNNEIEDYYYFGQVNKSLYEKIRANRISNGFIVLENVRYWASDDTIRSVTDELYLDEMVFRIEDIKKIDLIGNEPELGFKYPDEDEEQSDSDEFEKQEEVE